MANVEKVNIGDISLANPLDNLLIEYIPIRNWGRKVKLLFTNEAFPNLKWQE